MHTKSMLAYPLVRAQTSYPSRLPSSLVLPSIVLIISRSACTTMPVCIQSVEVRRTRKKLPGVIFVRSVAEGSRRNASFSFAEAARESHENEGTIGSDTPRLWHARFRQKQANPAHHAHSAPSCPSIYSRTQGPLFCPPISRGCCCRYCW